MKNYCILLLLLPTMLLAQPDRWQQAAKYKMKIDFDVETNQYDGEQKLTYYNNSPDTLHQVFYHLYFNAFQPGSMMDVRSLNIADPDHRVTDRISKLSEDEYGWQRVISLKHNGKNVRHHTEGTILEVTLIDPILPGKKATFEMKWKAQVPIQIRRSGRDNKEGVRYSMSQWYPKMCEYDYQGWHANPYIGREFYGIWGDYDVEIKIDDSYVLGAGGVLTNAKKIGRGYTDSEKEPKIKGKKISWKWKAENVHDFMWAADPEYVVNRHLTDAGVELFTVYQPGERTTENWEQLPRIMDAALTYMDKEFGKYPYPVYSIIQGGDGGMEYPMGTLITGERSIGSLVGVSVHEWMHSWYQMVLGSNEALYAWMDEGFVTFASSRVMNYLRIQKMIPGDPSDFPNAGSIRGYVNLSQSGLEEPLTVHSDHYQTNRGYGSGAYTKGAAVLTQLGYVIGDDVRDSGLRRYYHTWKFKHPNANDFFRVMERESGLELDWYKEHMVYTTNTIDYAINNVAEDGDQTKITLERVGHMPMPMDLLITYSNGTQTNVNIPLRIMRGEKPNEYPDAQYILAKDWPWTHPTYDVTIDQPMSTITRIEIDPSGRMADIDRENNVWEKP